MQEKQPLDKHTREGFGVKILKKSHRDILSLLNLKCNPSIHGHKFWSTSYLLMDYFTKHRPTLYSKVMEIGCGWGLAGIFCAKNFHAEVTSVDADPEVFPYLQLHAQLNEVEITTLERRFEKFTNKELLDTNLLIGAEVCFWSSMEKPLLKLLREAKKADVDNIVIADPGRPPFLRLAKRCQQEMNAKLLSWHITEPKWVLGHILVV